MTLPPFTTDQYLGKPLPLVRNPGLGIGVLIGLMFGLLGVISIVIAICAPDGEMSTKMLRFATILQDIVVFIAPAIIAAMVVTRLPATLLRLDFKPRLRPTLLACLILVTSMPAMNLIVQWNESISLPDSMSGLEETLQSLEGNANEAIASLLGGDTIPDLLLSILIIGLLTGLSEELFFRGAMQNFFFSTRMKRHLSVWLTAVIFSLMHFQFYGFIPRILLGAYFGYLIWWTGSVWVPILVHALNNSIAVFGSWMLLRSGEAESIEEATDTAISTDYITAILSLAVTALGIIILRRLCLKEARNAQHSKQ